MGFTVLSVLWKAAAIAPFLAAAVCSASRAKLSTTRSNSLLQGSSVVHAKKHVLVHENHGGINDLIEQVIDPGNGLPKVSVIDDTSLPEKVIDPGNGLPKVTVMDATSPPEMKLEPIVRNIDPQDHTIVSNAIGSEEPATPEVQQLCDSVKETALLTLQKKADLKGAGFKQFKALSYSSQVVFGVSYIVKVDIGDEHKFAMLKVFEPLPWLKKGPELIDVSFLYVYRSKQA